MAPLDNPAVPKGSTVLVTGANGLLGSHIVDQFLEYGYKVRGTVRDTEKNAWLQALFDKKYGKGSFELFKVADLAAEGAFDEAMKGTSVVAHTASITSFAPDPNDVIPQAIAFAENALKSAYKETSVKRFVLTSSSSAAVLSVPGAPGVEVLEDTWNEFAVKAAWAEPPYTPERGGVVYAASKTEAEKVVWKYHKENRDKRPDLVVNTVLPNFNFGKSLDPVNQGYPSSSGLPVALWQGQVTPFHHIIVPQYYINVQDTGRLHVAAAVFDHIKERRIFGFAGRFNWDEILDILRKVAPNKEFPANFSSGSDANEIKPRAEAEQLLRDLGRPGWVSLEETVLANVSDVKGA
ncbi:Epimerase domain-containing protein [Fusarium falciforme]|uniref:Epimerase domain-containing protein n=1 Tax=Fusarium falciforme TaxID=195108 RepID=UPI0023003F8F|nr:Epimerase domain-containing protein [Fusarium falciforme]WAO87457.1 Epimerase domain-containing protein [Fusarium falciforme]